MVSWQAVSQGRHLHRFTGTCFRLFLGPHYALFLLFFFLFLYSAMQKAQTWEQGCVLSAWLTCDAFSEHLQSELQFFWKDVGSILETSPCLCIMGLRRPLLTAKKFHVCKSIFHFRAHRISPPQLCDAFFTVHRHLLAPSSIQQQHPEVPSSWCFLSFTSALAQLFLALLPMHLSSSASSEFLMSLLWAMPCQIFPGLLSGSLELTESSYIQSGSLNFLQKYSGWPSKICMSFA